MNTTAKLHKTSLIDFGVHAPELLDQLDDKIGAAMLSRAAMLVSDLFHRVADQPAEDQCALVARLSTAALRNVDVNSTDSVAIAVGAATLLTVAKLGPATASERVRKALTILSERYQSDW